MWVQEIFQSIEGEVCRYYQGRITTFVRMAGCNLKCKWCDTSETQTINTAKEMSVKKVIIEIEKLGTRNVTITGGEPMMQREELISLLNKLKKDFYHVSVETNGTYAIDKSIVDRAGCWMMDYKPMSAYAGDFTSLGNYKNLRKTDFIKFPVDNHMDLREAFRVMKELRERKYLPMFAISPIIENVEYIKVVYKKVLEIIQKEGLLDIILNVQIHKMIDLP